MELKGSKKVGKLNERRKKEIIYLLLTTVSSFLLQLTFYCVCHTETLNAVLIYSYHSITGHSITGHLIPGHKMN